MKKKLYEKPSWGVIEMRQKPALLVGSAGLDDYQWNTPSEE